jgi:HAMP domain-containing protein
MHLNHSYAMKTAKSFHPPACAAIAALLLSAFQISSSAAPEDTEGKPHPRNPAPKEEKLIEEATREEYDALEKEVAELRKSWKEPLSRKLAEIQEKAEKIQNGKAAGTVTDAEVKKMTADITKLRAKGLKLLKDNEKQGEVWNAKFKRLQELKRALNLDLVPKETK